MNWTINLTFALVLSACGWLVSYYFLMVYRGKISHETRWMPPPIRIGGPACTDIVDSRFGRIFQQPNAYWGLWYYGLLIFVLLGGWFFSLQVNSILIVITGITLVFSLYLLYGLYSLKVACRPCITTHMINLFLFIIVLMQII
ncbi:MAG: vitamin K epoxide reductase family protein [Candidatus Marinimicrobia bacterium]|nr:vitamin K epoxide reductase family protein [Candidatus Neomarinimicrobiota bacterium]